MFISKGYLYEFNEFDTKLSHLDKNHSHFILIRDKNPKIEFGGEIDLRNSFEKKLEDMKSIYSHTKFEFLLSNILPYKFSSTNCGCCR